MKKGLPLLLILAFVLPQYSQAQGLVKRKRVLMEVMTGTWCVFCPGSAMGADDMVQNGHDIAIVKHHVGDSYQNAASLSRETLYNVNSYPTTIFNGDDFYSGGSTNNSLYNAYFGRYQANQDSTPIDMTMRVVRDGNQMKVQVDVTQVGTYTGNLVLHVSLTESHIPDSWFGQTEVNFASRGMYPTFSGTSLNLMEGVTQSYEIIAPVNSSWVVENMEAVVWIQDITTNEVMNADRVKLLFPDQIYEVKADAITSNTPAYQCASDQNEFTISVLNTDADTVTSMDITYQLNEELASIYNWTGVLPYEESVDITLPIVANLGDSINNLRIEVSSVNGKRDQDTTNNTLLATWETPYAVAGDYKLDIETDIFGAETTWDLKDPSGTVVISGGPYTNGGQTQHSYTFNLPENPGCHSLTFYDINGNGMGSILNGSYTLYDPTGKVVIENLTGQFENEIINNFEMLGPNTSTLPEVSMAISVYPNPSTGLFSVLNKARFLDAQWQLISLDGRKIQSGVIEGEKWQLDLSNEAEGIYLLNIIGEKQSYQQKLVKK